MHDVFSFFNESHDSVLIDDNEHKERKHQRLNDFSTKRNHVVAHDHFVNVDDLSCAKEKMMTFNDIVNELTFIPSTWIFETNV